MIRFKESARLDPTSQPIISMLIALQHQSVTDGRDYTVTSGNDSKHADTSKHYTNQALDVRVHGVESPERLRAELQALLGEKFTVIYEMPGTPNAHIHMQVRKGAVAVDA